MPGGFEAMGFFRTGLSNYTTWPDLQVLFLSFQMGVDAGMVYARMKNLRQKQVPTNSLAEAI